MAEAIEADRIAEILKLADQVIRADGKGIPRRRDLVWTGLSEAMDTLRRLPDREAGWLYAIKSCWPEVAYDHSERLEVWESMLERIKIGELPKEALAVRSPPPSARAISRMEYAFGWHRYLLGKNKRRDWKVICLLASGKPATIVGRMNRLHRNSVYDRKELQSGAIATGLVDRYGEGIFPAT